MDTNELEAIKKMVIHGLYAVTLRNGYTADVFAAFKAEQERLFSNYESVKDAVTRKEEELQKAREKIGKLVQESPDMEGSKNGCE